MRVIACIEEPALIDLLTRIYGPRANDLAIQVHGGAGCTREPCSRQSR